MDLPRGWIEVKTTEHRHNDFWGGRRLILASRVGTIIPEWAPSRDSSSAQFESSITIDGQQIHVCMAPEALAEAINKASEAGVNGLDSPSEGTK